MHSDDLTAPSLADIERLAQAAFDTLPQVFRRHCQGASRSAEGSCHKPLACGRASSSSSMITTDSA